MQTFDLRQCQHVKFWDFAQSFGVQTLFSFGWYQVNVSDIALPRPYCYHKEKQPEDETDRWRMEGPRITEVLLKHLKAVFSLNFSICELIQPLYCLSQFELAFLVVFAKRNILIHDTVPRSGNKQFHTLATKFCISGSHIFSVLLNCQKYKANVKKISKTSIQLNIKL